MNERSSEERIERYPIVCLSLATMFGIMGYLHYEHSKFTSSSIVSNHPSYVIQTAQAEDKNDRRKESSLTISASQPDIQKNKDFTLENK